MAITLNTHLVKVRVQVNGSGQRNVGRRCDSNNQPQQESSIGTALEARLAASLSPGECSCQECAEQCDNATGRAHFKF